MQNELAEYLKRTPGKSMGKGQFQIMTALCINAKCSYRGEDWPV